MTTATIEDADMDDAATDAKIDAYHAGWFAGFRGEARPAGEVEGEGWVDGRRDRKVRVIMPRRPEGYYHAPIGTFD